MKNLQLSAILILLISSLSAFAQSDKEKALWWKFEGDQGRKVTEAVTGTNDTIEGNYVFVQGIEGKALKLDGFTTAIRHQPAEKEKITGSFTTEAWVAMAAYPWNWCPVISQMDPEQGGFSMEIGPRGEFGLKMNIAGNFVSCISDEKIPLRKWVHIAAVYQEGKALNIYLNGEPAGTYKTTGRPVFAPNEEIRIGMNYEAVKPSNQIGDTGNKPYWFSLDGIIDELVVLNEAVDQSKIKEYTAQYEPIPESGLQRRLMPRGPDAPDKFAAYYTKLKYYDEWDNQWPVESEADIVVTFKDTPVRLIFWRGTRYSPAWVTDKDQWMCDQSVEAWNGAEGCFEHMQDRHCRYSHVRIIENTDARKVIHWRYAPVSAYNNLWREDKKTGWAVWVDEYYFIYPDATAIRRVSWKTGALGYPRQFQESLPLTNPEQVRGDILEPDYLAVANLDGDIQYYEYIDDMSKANKKKAPESPNIQQHNFKSPYDPFIIFEPGNEMHYISDRDISLFDLPGSCNHWPVGQAYCDGRRTQAADRPSHFLGFPISRPVIHQKDGRNYIYSIYGMKDIDINELIEIGKSWAQAPKLQLKDPDNNTAGQYDMSQKAYVIDNHSKSKNAELAFRIEASGDSPLVNPAFVINNWNNGDPVIRMNGKELKKGRDYYTGHVDKPEGSKMIIWLNNESRDVINMEVSTKW